MSQANHKKKVAIFYGGPSPEHDVSVVTALQVFGAIDPQRYDAFLVYITPDGRWYIGDALKERKNYLFDREATKQLTQVTLDLNRTSGTAAKGRLMATQKKIFSPAVAADFDIALPAFHGLYGEDGNFQGVMEYAGIPYAGVRMMPSAIFMDKAVTKTILRALDIPVLPCAQIKRPDQGLMVAEHVIADAMDKAQIGFPCILKPTHLGSSIGVAKVSNTAEVAACLPDIFRSDTSAILEPFVSNLVEYNVAVAKINGQTVTSAIERPKTTDELLDFKQKYLSGGGDNKTGTKSPGAISQGMLSLTRELNPDIPAAMRDKIIGWVSAMYDDLSCGGAPRVDCIGDSKTGDLWLNEINPFPGSAGYFLWEASENNPLLFSELITHLLEEAVTEHKKKTLDKDPVPKDARLLKRSLSE